MRRPPPPPRPPPRPDHRPAVAAARRDRMRTHLVESTLRTVLAHGTPAIALEPLLVQAGVSRGTFYKYFPDVTAVVQAVAAALSDELIASLDLLVQTFDDPAERLAAGMLGVLGLVQKAPLLGQLLTRTGWPEVEPAADHAFHRLVRADVERGQRARRFIAMDATLAMELLAAHVVAASRRIAAGDSPAALARETVAALLRCLGVEASEARLLARRPLRATNLAPGPLLRLVTPERGPAAGT